MGYPYVPLRHPPRPRLCRDTHTLLPAPHPARAFGAPPPPPEGGRGSAWRYQGSSRIRVGAGGQPCQVLLRDLPMCWTVEISPRGEGPTGRGNSFPLPCLPHSNHLTSRRPPPHPRLRRSAPAPRGGQGQCVAISGEQPYPGLLRDLPMCWTVEISPRGEGPTGRGNSFPLPCLPHSNHLTSRRHPLPAPPAG